MSFDAAKAIFNQVDANGDNQIDQNEFSQWLRNQSSGAAGFEGASSGSSYEATSFSSGGGDAFAGADAFSAAGAGAGAGAASFEASSSSSSASGALAVQRYATDAQGYFLDQNPLVVRAAAADCPPVYMQNVKVRLLQPPPLEPHGVCCIIFSDSHMNCFFFK